MEGSGDNGGTLPLTYIDEFVGTDFYKRLDLNYRTTFHFGQLFWTHAYYPHENLEVFRPIFDPGEPTKTTADKFRLVTAGGDAFNRSIPLHVPSLKVKEEFLAIRAKIRPVILVRPEIPIPEAISRGQGGRLAKRRCLVAQVFSIADPVTGKIKFTDEFINRVRLLEYPQFMFFPKKVGVLEVDSLLRLDECQCVFTPHLDPTQFMLCDDLRDLLRYQFLTLFSDKMHIGYKTYREELMRD